MSATRRLAAVIVLAWGLGGIRAEAQLLATGGDAAYITNINGTVYGVHIYTNVGAHTFTPHTDMECEALIVAGGGGGGGRYMAGGGGAGGWIHSNACPLASGSNYEVRVGAGGAGGSGENVRGSNGSNSVFGVIAATGGGGGGS